MKKIYNKHDIRMSCLFYVYGGMSDGDKQGVYGLHIGAALGTGRNHLPTNDGRIHHLLSRKDRGVFLTGLWMRPRGKRKLIFPQLSSFIMTRVNASSACISVLMMMNRKQFVPCTNSPNKTAMRSIFLLTGCTMRYTFPTRENARWKS